MGLYPGVRVPQDGPIFQHEFGVDRTSGTGMPQRSNKPEEETDDV